MSVENTLNSVPLPLMDLLTQPIPSKSSSSKKLSNPFSSFSDNAKQLYKEYKSLSAKAVTKMTGKVLSVSGRVTFKAVSCLEEMIAGLKPIDPQDCIIENQQRLHCHDEKFLACCEFFVDRMVEGYLQHHEQIKQQIVEKIQDYPSAPFEETSDYSVGEDPLIFDPILGLKCYLFEQASEWIGWFMERHKDLIAKTIKANLFNILANLSDEAFVAEYVDERLGPFGKILSSLGLFFQDFESEWGQLEECTEEEREVKRRQLLQKMASELLLKLFPKKEKDIKLFHHSIPVTLFQTKIWKKMNQELPGLFYQLYKEINSLSSERSNWAAEFDRIIPIEGAHQMRSAFSAFAISLFAQHGQKVRSLFQPKLEAWMVSKGLSAETAPLVGTFLFQEIQVLFSTHDSSLIKWGSFFEHYFMDRLLFNAMQSAQERGEERMEEQQEGQHPLLETYFVKLMNQAVKRADQPSEADQALCLTRELLIALKLNREESFPLPPFLKKMIWPTLERFQTERLPLLLAESINDQVAHLGALRQDNAGALEEWTNNPRVTQWISEHISRAVEKGMEWLRSFNLAEAIDHALASERALTEQQREELHGQWRQLLQLDGAIESYLKKWGNRYLKSVVFHLLVQLYAHYRQRVEEAQEPYSSILSWLVDEWALKCQELDAENLTEQKLMSLKRAVELKNEIHFSQDEALRHQKQEELTCLWSSWQAEFTRLVEHAFHLLGCHTSTDLPLPKIMQAPVWKLIQTELPKLLFEQASDLLLPLMERQRHRQLLGRLPQGEAIAKGCHLLARDIRAVLPRLIGSYRHLSEEMNRKIFRGMLTVEQVQELERTICRLAQTNDVKVKTLFHACESFFSMQAYAEEEAHEIKQNLRVYKNRILDIALTPEKVVDKLESNFIDLQEQKLVVDTLQACIHQPQAFTPLWNFIERYIEGMLLKIAVNLSQIDPLTIRAIQTLAANAREALVGQTVEQAQPILTRFTDELFILLNLEVNASVFGLPSSMSEKIVLATKAQVAKALLGIYHSFLHVRHLPFREEEGGLPISQVAQAISALTRYAMDQAVFQATHRVEGQLQVISPLYTSLHGVLNGLSSKGWKIAGLFQDLIAQQLPTPSLEAMLEGLKGNEDALEACKQQMNAFINPLLTTEILKLLNPLINQERQNKAFDQVLIKGLLPAFLQHLKHLNEAASEEGGLTFANFAKAAGDALHPAIPVDGGVEEGRRQREEFYKKQTKQVLKLLFPQGKRDLLTLIPDLPHDVIIDVWRGIKSTLTSQLPTLLPSLFEEDVLTDAVTNLYENILESYTASVEHIQQPSMELTREEEAAQREIEGLLGECLIEIARFIHLPIDHLSKLPENLKWILSFDKLQEKSLAAIQSAVRSRLNGELINKGIREALLSLAEKRSVSLTEEERVAARRAAQLNLDRLERQVVERGIAYAIRLLGARIEHACDIFSGTLTRKIKTAILAISAFVMIRCTGALLRFFNIDHFFISRLCAFLRRIREDVFEKLKRPDLHENLIFQEVEALEAILTSDPVS